MSSEYGRSPYNSFYKQREKLNSYDYSMEVGYMKTAPIEPPYSDIKSTLTNNREFLSTLNSDIQNLLNRGKSSNFPSWSQSLNKKYTYKDESLTSEIFSK